MEPQKRGKYSKLLEPEETEEILMDKDFDEELEETDERTQSSSSSEDEECDGLCIVNCFEKWHTHVNLWAARHSSVDCRCTKQLISL